MEIQPGIRCCMICGHNCKQKEPEHRVSPRELTILRLIALAYSNKGIAAEVGITTNSIKVLISKLYKKIGIANHENGRFAALRFWNAHPELHAVGELMHEALKRNKAA